MAKTASLPKAQRRVDSYPTRIRALLASSPTPLTHRQITDATGAPYASVQAIVRPPLYAVADSSGKLPAWLPAQTTERK